MSKPRVVIPDDSPRLFGSTDHPALQELSRLAEVDLPDTRWEDREELFRRIAPATAIINVRAYSKFDAEALGHAPELKFITVVGTGVDNIDLEAATARGVLVANTPGVASEAVAELAVALMFAVARHVAACDRDVKSGGWVHYPSLELRGKTLGLVGIGSIGSRMAALGAGLGMSVVGWNRTESNARAAAPGVELMGLDDVLRESDVLSLHVRSTPETRGMIGERELALMKPTAILVNTARAALVDYQALAGAIREHRLAGAGLDVFDEEPLPAERNIFRDLDSVILTPHSGAVTEDANERSIREAVANVTGYLEGRPYRVVNPAR